MSIIQYQLLLPLMLAIATRLNPDLPNHGGRRLPSNPIE